MADQYIFPPLAAIVDEYARSTYHLLKFNGADPFGYMRVIGSTQAISELDAIEDLLQDFQVTRYGLFETSIDRLRYGTVDIFNDGLTYSSANPHTILVEYYSENPDILLDEITKTWMNKLDPAFVLVEDTNVLYQIARAGGLISGL